MKTPPEYKIADNMLEKYPIDEHVQDYQATPAFSEGRANTKRSSSSRCRRLASIMMVLLCSFTATLICVRLVQDVKHKDTDAYELLRSSPLIDTHNDFPIFIRAFYQNDIYQENFTAEEKLPSHVDFPRLRRGHLAGQFWSVFVECPKDTEHYGDEVYYESIHDTLQQIDLVDRLIQQYPTHLRRASTAQEVKENFADSPHRISSLMGIEGLHQIGNSASILRLYHRLGVRYATLTHSCHNRYADSERPSTPLHNGLSDAGREMVLEMNRVGMMVDISHTSAATQRDALATSLAPVIFSHSNAYALCNHTRNAPDDVLHSLKENNGVIMVTFLPAYLNSDADQASLADVADHIQYIGDLIGYRHVGIGSDYDGMLGAPKGLEDVSKYPALIEELLNRGVSARDIKNVMGLNILRVLEDVEQVAADLSTRMKPLQDPVTPMLGIVS